MGFWEIVTPKAAITLVTNPHGQTATTGYSALSGGAVALETAITYFGTQSIKYTPSATTTDGWTYPITLVAATPYYIKHWCYGALGVPLTLLLYDVTGAVVLGSTNFTGTGAYQKVTLSVTTTTHTSHAIQVVKNTSASVAPFYNGGLNCIANGVSDTYVDGDQPGCVWDGTPHASTSRRLVSSAAGGAINLLSDLGLYIDEQGGSGMPPIENVVLPYGIVDGGFYQRTIARPRPFTLKGTATASTYAALHATRAALIDTITRDRTAIAQPILLRYNGTGSPLQISAVYTGGLELTKWRGFTETAALSLLAPDPFFAAEGDSHLALSSSAGLQTFAYFAIRDTTETWGDLSTAFNGAVNAIVEDPVSHVLYIGGAFTNAGGNANADAIVQYDPTTGVLTALGTGCNNTVNAIVLDRNGDLYVGGAFTDAGGSGADYVAKYTVGTATWSVLGSATAITAEVRALTIDSNAVLYIGGDFTSGGGVAGADYIVAYGGAYFLAGSASALNARVRAFAIQRGAQGISGDKLYVGGDFTNASGNANADYVALFTPATALWSALSTGMSALVRALAVSPFDATLYVGGDFVTAGGTTVNGIAAWNSASFAALGSGVNTPVVRSLAISPIDGSLYVGGDFTGLGAAQSNRLAVWTGSTWLPADFLPFSTTEIRAICINRYGRPVIGMSASAGHQRTQPTTVTISGGASVQPKLVMAGLGACYVINYTTGERLVLSAGGMGGTDTAIVDLAAHTITTPRDGSLLGTVVPGSDFSTWHLLPGDNSIGTFGTAASHQLLWRERYWSCDG